MKNYFSDKKIIGLVHSHLGYKSNFNNNSKLLLEFKDLQSIMNLAVETAIKEFNVEDLNERLAKFDQENKPSPLNLDIKYDI